MRRIKKVLLIIFSLFICMSCAQSLKDDDDDSKIYLVIFGTNQYYKNGCSKIRSQAYTPITLGEAKEKGYEKCNVCFKN